MIRLKLIPVVLLVLTITACEDDSNNGIGQFNKDVKAIDSYLASNGIDAYEDASGIRFVIKSIGTGGLPPKRLHSVTVDYVGRLLADGKVFDSGITTGNVTGFIPGWVEALEVMPIGTEATLYIPSSLGYGNQGVGIIPPNANLVFDIALLEVDYTSQEEQQFPLDISAIDQYLDENEIEAIEDGTGIRYVITEIGTGPIPFWYDKVQVTYKGILMDDTSEPFYSGTVEPREGFDSRVVDFLPGLQAMFRNLPSGSKATAYIPSVLGFGSAGAGNGAVPANANLIYEISSFEIVD